MQRISRTAERSRTGRHRPLVTLAALFAILLQAFAIQTHVHIYTPFSAPALVQAGGEDAHAHGAHASLAHGQVLCAICQALAASGTAVLPPDANLTETPAIAREAAAIVLPDAPRAQTHSWRSRAPPISL